MVDRKSRRGSSRNKIGQSVVGIFRVNVIDFPETQSHGVISRSAHRGYNLRMTGSLVHGC